MLSLNESILVLLCTFSILTIKDNAEEITIVLTRYRAEFF